MYVPTEEERRMLGEAVTDLERHPEAGRSWEEVRVELWRIRHMGQDPGEEEH